MEQTESTERPNRGFNYIGYQHGLEDRITRKENEIMKSVAKQVE